jgi:hypothetical protein
MTPIFSRIWLMKMRQVRERLTAPVSLRSGGDGVDHQNVDLAGADEVRRDFERLLAEVGLRYQEVIDVHAELFRVDRVERVLDVDEGRDAALLLRFGDHLERDGGFAGRLRTEDFVDAAAREAAHAQSGVE